MTPQGKGTFGYSQQNALFEWWELTDLWHIGQHTCGVARWESRKDRDGNAGGDAFSWLTIAANAAMSNLWLAS